MSANPSVNEQKTDMISFRILINGKEIASVLNVISIRVTKMANKIPIAKVLITADGANSNGLDMGNTNTFIPGNKIEIEAGYQGETKRIFLGIIIKQGLKIRQETGAALEIECCDEAIKATIGRKNVYYLEQTDADMIMDVISRNGLTADVESTKPAYAELVQYYATDWDFILTRAERNGLIVLVDAGKVSVVSPLPSKRPKVLQLTYGFNILEFDAEMDAQSQLISVESASWDYQQQKIITRKAQSSNVNAVGNLSSPNLAKVTAPKVFKQQTTVPLDQTALQVWSNAQILKSEMAKLRGRVQFQGNALVNPGDVITLSGLSKRFDGDVLVSGVVQTIENGSWLTEAVLGLSPEWFSEQSGLADTPAAGLLPAVEGLQNGIVKQVDKDPQKQYRVLVEIPILEKGKGVWARLATNSIGEFAYPEIGDEVVLGFFNDDPRSPVILGCLYSHPKHKPPFTSEQKNQS